MLDGLVTAMRTLTVLSVPGKDADEFSRSLYWFPLVGLLLGLLQAALAWIGMVSQIPEFSAVLVLLSGVLLTRAIHADGLADLADGFFGGKTRESRLRIMKDPAVGSFGVIALILLFLFKWIALTRIVAHGQYEWIVSGIVLARFVQVVLASVMAYAREGEGTACRFVAGAGGWHVVVAALFSLLILVLVMKMQPLPIVVALLATAVSGSLTGMLAAKKIHGVTGDVLGASSEMTEALVWCSALLLLFY
ncbi:MAG: adenosylcobinamide-GDP ribazoletransferase [Prosthecochloris sp.]|uniref:adenosylcobinamide-GDP ribazoletransferase n=1 Tax=Prosthecochloris sp. TaxID=290513 RepID=UPI0025850658|nr:adenosylcobinamide-GDP ribazoletransferase [Prosthecochloris sp.]MCW8797331.1 adenosylcobinamide-GDP ribazoletransferase [Prosthecochloris sp.]